MDWRLVTHEQDRRCHSIASYGAVLAPLTMQSPQEKCFFQGETLSHEMQFCVSHTCFNKWLVIFLSLLFMPLVKDARKRGFRQQSLLDFVLFLVQMANSSHW
ncbi:hypothetical protein BDA96_01G175400 [Sorghum bicolor]|nr:hypothetical protein BDA96_01G175400 [Sorghum bicolor]